MKILLNLILLFLCLRNVVGYNFLAIFPVPGRSHHILGAALIKSLANAGHNITFISALDDPNLPKNVKMIVVDEAVNQMKKEMAKFNLFDMESISPFLKAIFLNDRGARMVEVIFNSSQVKTMLKSNVHFDAVIIEQFASDGLKIFAHYYQAPLILFSSIGPSKFINGLVANPSPPSYIPEALLDKSSKDLTLCNRLYNFLLGIFVDINFHYVVVPKQNALVKKYFPNAPELTKYLYNIALVLVNSHESFHQPVPLVPNVIGIGGFHVNPPKSLPKDLQQFMDNAKEGVIYFSMGSNVIPSKMHKEKLDVILKVLGSRKEKVLWKWDQDNLEGVPNNFMISKWFPQQAILAHPNCKLFISHGGLLSITETVTMGVPVLTFPIFGDQKMNAAQAAALEFGVNVPYPEINEKTLSSAINKVLNDPKYRNNAKLRSELMKDRPVKPADLAVYWIEYVARYKGAQHLRVAGVDLPLYQYLLLDVIALILAANIAAIFITWKLFRFLNLRRNNKKTAKEEKGKKMKNEQKTKQKSKLKNN